MSEFPLSKRVDQTGGLGILACRDFFFETRICDTAKELNREVRCFSDADRIAQTLSTENVPVLLIDLSTMSDCLDELPRFRELAPGLSVIAFGSHVQTDLLNQARQAGCDSVLTRSRFTGELVNLLQKYLPPR